MKYLKNAFELYINSSIHVSLAVVAFTLISFLEHHLIIDWNLILFIFFASVTGYNFVKYSGIASLHHLSLTRNLRIIQIFSLICFLALVYFTFLLKKEVIIATAIMGAFTIFYAVPILGKGKNLRSLSGLKIFIIALVWAGSSAILPLINEGKYLEIDILVDFLQRLMLVLVLTLPFEIRDLRFDEETLGTIPQRLGTFMTKVFGTILLFIIFSIELVQKSFSSDEFLALFIALILTGIFLWSTNENQKKYYCSFWVEGVPVFYLGVYCLFRFFLPQIPF